MSANTPGWAELRADAKAGLGTAPDLGPILAPLLAARSPAEGLAGLLSRLPPANWLPTERLRAIALAAYAAAPDAVAASFADLETIHRLNFEPGGRLGIWLGGRGFHVLAAWRVAHALWMSGQQALALAWKTGAGVLGADIHPAAQIGPGIFLDHGIGVVIGETAVIEPEVCLWHGVTLGSTLMQEGDRHPKIRRGAILGAGATILGNIEIGEGAVVAAGSMVLASVPPFTTAAGNPAKPRASYAHPYGYTKKDLPP